MADDQGIELTQSFLVVADELNFRRAAERLNLDQSALTRRVQKLEHLLGFELFERSTREVALTPAGRQFLTDTAHLMTRWRESVAAARRVAEGKSGLLRVAYMAFAATELMPRAVAAFRETHPHVDVELRYLRSQGQKLALANGEVDVGFMIGPFDHPDYRTLPLLTEALYAVMPLDHPLTARQQVVPADLAGVPVILGDMREWGEYRWRLSDMFHSAGIELDVVLEASNTLALIGLVAAGLGITVYPQSLIGFLGHNVTVRRIDEASFSSTTVLCWRRGGDSALLRDFARLAQPAG